jgi:regulator of nucleoside diphosphate kinase
MTERIVVREDDAARLQRLLATSGRWRDNAAITALQDELDRAEIVGPESMPAGVVAMGTRVRFVDEDSGDEQEVVLVYPAQADPVQGRISVLAPVGSALLGLRVGQSIEWPMPNGRNRRLRVRSVDCGGGKSPGARL